MEAPGLEAGAGSTKAAMPPSLRWITNSVALGARAGAASCNAASTSAEPAESVALALTGRIATSVPEMSVPVGVDVCNGGAAGLTGAAQDTSSRVKPHRTNAWQAIGGN